MNPCGGPFCRIFLCENSFFKLGYEYLKKAGPSLAYGIGAIMIKRCHNRVRRTGTSCLQHRSDHSITSGDPCFFQSDRHRTDDIGVLKRLLLRSDLCWRIWRRRYAEEFRLFCLLSAIAAVYFQSQASSLKRGSLRLNRICRPKRKPRPITGACRPKREPPRPITGACRPKREPPRPIPRACRPKKRLLRPIPRASTEKRAVPTDNWCMSTEKRAAATDNSCMSTEKRATATDNRCMSTEKRAVPTDNRCMSTEKRAAATDPPCIPTEKKAAATDTPCVDRKESRSDR